MLQGRKLVVIMGAARSGTTWLQAMLAAHEQVCTSTELSLFSEYTALWTSQWEKQEKRNQHNVQVGLPAIWDRDKLLVYLRKFLEAVYAEVLVNKPDATIIVDKTPNYTSVVEHIFELIPNVHFVHIVRDGRDVVASTLESGKGWGYFWATQDARQAAIAWKNAVKSGRMAQQFQGQYTEVRYRDLLRAGPEVLKSVFRDIGLNVELSEATQIYDSHHIDKMRRSHTIALSKNNTVPDALLVPKGFFRRGQAGSWVDDLGPMERYRVFQAAGDLLSELGYTQDDGWWYTNYLEKYLIPPLSVGQSAALSPMESLRRRLGLPVRKLVHWLFATKT